MSKQVRLRRGTTAQHTVFCGADGELTYDTERKCLVMHDGATPGGHPMLSPVLLAPGDLMSLQSVSSRVAILGGSASTAALSVNNAAYFGGPTTIGDLQSPVVYLGGGGATIIDFAAGRLQIMAPLSGDAIFSGANRQISRSCAVFIPNGASTRYFGFPGGWRFLGVGPPYSIVPNKIGWLELWCLGGNETDVLARYSVQS